MRSSGCLNWKTFFDFIRPLRETIYVFFGFVISLLSVTLFLNMEADSSVNEEEFEVTHLTQETILKQLFEMRKYL